MMYNTKLAAAIKVNGKILREFKDTVYVPFGSEYSIHLKNLNTVRAIVNVFIDGTNVVPGGLVLNAGQDCDLERSIANGNMNEGNKFKFIERTGAVEQHRGIKLEDGIVRIEYEFEKVYLPPLTRTFAPRHIHNYYEPADYYGARLGGEWTDSSLGGSGYSSGGKGSSMGPLMGSPLRGSSLGASADMKCSMAASTVNLNNITVGASLSDIVGTPQNAVQNDAGITVAGGKSEQKFTTASWFATDGVKLSMVLRLLGETEDNKPVIKPVTVKAKPKCTSCGHTNKHSAKFCTQCGTSLVLFA